MKKITHLISLLVWIAIIGLVAASSVRADEIRAASATSQCVQIKILNSTLATGAGRTGITPALSGFGCAYSKGTAPATAITLVTQAPPTWVDGGFYEIDATNKPGEYRVCLPNAAFTGSVSYVTLTCQGGSNVAQSDLRILLQPPVTVVDTAANSIKETAFAPTGLVGSGSTTGAVQLAVGETTNDITGQQLCIQSGVASKSCRPITAYNTGTKIATVSPVLTVAPANGDGYNIGGYVASSGGGSCPTASTIASAVWSSLRSAFTAVGTFGEGTPKVFGNVDGSVGGNVIGSTASCTALGAGAINAASFAANTPFAQATAQSVATAGQVTLASGAPFGNQAINNNFVIYISETTGNGVGQMACIKNYNSGSKVATLTKAFQIPLTGTVKYMILPSANCNMSLWPTSH